MSALRHPTTPAARSAPRVHSSPESPFDIVSALTIYVVVLLGLPSRLTVGPLGGAGNPASLLAIGVGLWWVVDRIHQPEASRRRPAPVRRALLIAVFCATISYLVAMTRAIASTEISSADLGMLVLIAWGSILLAADGGISSQSRLETLCRRLVLATAFVAALGLLQFVTGQLWIDRIHVPGLVTNQALGGLSSRGSFNRPSGTALHAIEFGSVLTMVLPIAINTALTDRTRSTFRRWAPVGLISLAIVLSISRSALICGAVGLLVVAWRWSPAVRRRAATAGVALAGFVFLTVPGMLGTLLGMFTGISSDGSALSRVDSYSLAGRFIAESPLFGRGLSTFLPAYRILDNQWLVLLIEIGIVGTAAFLWLMTAGILASFRARTLAPDDGVAQRAQGLAAGIAAGAVGLAFYDGFAFPMANGTLFLLLGLSGAQLRLVQRERSARSPAERSEGATKP